MQPSLIAAALNQTPINAKSDHFTVSEMKTKFRGIVPHNSLAGRGGGRSLLSPQAVGAYRFYGNTDRQSGRRCGPETTTDGFSRPAKQDLEVGTASSGEIVNCIGDAVITVLLLLMAAARVSRDAGLPATQPGPAQSVIACRRRRRRRVDSCIKLIAANARTPASVA